LRKRGLDWGIKFTLLYHKRHRKLLPRTNWKENGERLGEKGRKQNRLEGRSKTLHVERQMRSGGLGVKIGQ